MICIFVYPISIIFHFHFENSSINTSQILLCILFYIPIWIFVFFSFSMQTTRINSQKKNKTKNRTKNQNLYTKSNKTNRVGQSTHFPSWLLRHGPFGGVDERRRHRGAAQNGLCRMVVHQSSGYVHQTNSNAIHQWQCPRCWTYFLIVCFLFSLHFVLAQETTTKAGHPPHFWIQSIVAVRNAPPAGLNCECDEDSNKNGRWQYHQQSFQSQW